MCGLLSLGPFELSLQYNKILITPKNRNNDKVQKNTSRATRKKVQKKYNHIKTQRNNRKHVQRNAPINGTNSTCLKCLNLHSADLAHD